MENLVLNGKIYDVLKWVALIGLPPVATLYSTLSGIWGLPFGQEVSATIMAIDTCLGVLIGVSSINYNKADAGDQ